MHGGKVSPVEQEASDACRTSGLGRVEAEGLLLEGLPTRDMNPGSGSVEPQGEGKGDVAGAGGEVGPQEGVAPAKGHGDVMAKKMKETSEAEGSTIYAVHKANRKPFGDGAGDTQLVVFDEVDDDPIEKVQPSGESIFDMLGVDSSAMDLAQWRKKILDIVDGVWVSVFMTLITIYVLFIDDLRLACFPPAADDQLVIVTIICLIFFVVELVLNSLGKPAYFIGFYFWLDLVASLSLLGDIPQFMEAITLQDNGENGGVSDSTTLARAGRTSRAGTRAGRIARVMRLIRLVRLVKLYRHYESNKSKAEVEMSESEAASAAKFDERQKLKEKKEEEEEDEEEVAESRVGQKLSDLTTRRVIIGVLGMLFILPIFDIDAGMFGENSAFDTGGLEMVHEVALTSGVGSTSLMAAVEVFQENIHYKLGTRSTSRILSLSVLNSTVIPRSDAERRQSELSGVQFTTDECSSEGNTAACLVTEAIYDLKWYSQLNAILNIFRTIFIIIVLGLGALLFSRDANNLVLRPLERMIQKVKEISENPLARQAMVQDVGKTEDARLETKILENSIMKICSLLAVGFGDAGAEVIAENMKKEGALNPMVPGRRMMAVFGFCDIRQFTDTTEVLQEEVMEFVNSIARVVHMEVALHGGAANKNIGDAFLLVWKLPRGTRLKDLRMIAETDDDMENVRRSSIVSRASDDGRVTPTVDKSFNCNTLSRSMSMQSMGFARMPLQEKRSCINALADGALASFVIIQAALKRSASVKKYAVRQDLNARMPGYDVRMGFGLHLGWAIEGAIGSEYKVDASYLSPNVNMASRLEAATKQFGSTILLSSDFVNCLSPMVQRRCRQIDFVTVKGSTQPMGLYTYDVSTELIPDADMSASASPEAEEYVTYSGRQYGCEWEEHPDLLTSWGLTEEFLEKFSEGFMEYLNGNWERAVAILEVCRTQRRTLKSEVVEDGPSVTLLNYMATMNNRSPSDWRGYRELTEK